MRGLSEAIVEIPFGWLIEACASHKTTKKEACITQALTDKIPINSDHLFITKFIPLHCSIFSFLLLLLRLLIRSTCRLAATAIALIRASVCKCNNHRISAVSETELFF